MGSSQLCAACCFCRLAQEGEVWGGSAPLSGTVSLSDIVTTLQCSHGFQSRVYCQSTVRWMSVVLADSQRHSFPRRTQRRWPSGSI